MKDMHERLFNDYFFESPIYKDELFHQRYIMRKDNATSHEIVHLENLMTAL